ncbi:SURF1 family protein [Aureimonas fodinaquatilis]|uniref:SURF1-like protein n=2 Tax=Aureimonas fodinaquatilis TaxID=2565783 RepID=A0A5B0E0Y7_9HYPH|nr:SURF1 family protein [Aureimonas fodinaquatilis]
MSPVRFWTALVLGLVSLAILISLGTWQVERLGWKQDLIAKIEDRANGPVLSFDEVSALFQDTGDVDYVPIRVRGRFDHTAERHFLSTYKGESGWNIFTPLILDDGSDAIFINRGFVPYPAKDPAKRAEGQIAGEVEVDGLARNPALEKPDLDFTPDNDLAENTFFWKNLLEMAQGVELPEGVKLAPFVVDAKASEVPGGYPTGGQTIITIPNNHLEYAITWYGIAAMLGGLLVFLVVQQRRGG